MLRGLGFHKISTAGSADASGADAALQRPGHMVDAICDLNMPGVDGTSVHARGWLPRSFSGGVILLSGEGTHHAFGAAPARWQRRADPRRAGRSRPAATRAEGRAWKRWRPAQPCSAMRPPLPSYSACGPSEPPCSTSSGFCTTNRRWTCAAVSSAALRGPGALEPSARRHGEGRITSSRWPRNSARSGRLTGWIHRPNSLRQLVRWQAAGLDINLSVNISMEDLNAPDFARAGVGER